MTTLSTEWSRAMGLDAPIVNAPMGGVAGGALAAAVSRAGALGMVGIGSAGCALLLDEQLGHLRELGRPFGIGLVEWVIEGEPQLLTAAIAAKPALLSVSFGEDFSWVRRAHDAGIAAATQVGDLRAAARAVEAGCDVVIARGAEAGGHGEPTVGTLPLLAAILDHLAVPVLAAGGVSSGRALAAVLAAGASGAWLGTAFCACTETLSSDKARRALLAAQDTDTVSTRVFDIAAALSMAGDDPRTGVAQQIHRPLARPRTGAVRRPPCSPGTGSGHRRRRSPPGTDQRRTGRRDAANRPSRSRGDRSTVRRRGPTARPPLYALALPPRADCLRPLPKPI